MSNDTEVKSKKALKPDELRQALMSTLEKLYEQDPESLPFRRPVDTVFLQIPEYLDIVKQPMDLSTIKRKLETDQYQDPWQYVDDVWLMFDNCWLYNREASRVYKHGTKLAEVFKQEIDPVMHSLGYCCRRDYISEPQDTNYLKYQDRYTCRKCVSENPGDTATLSDDPTQTPK